jgi:hypothetical protein
VAERRFGRGNSPARTDTDHRPRRGFVSVKLPRHVIVKTLASGAVSFYYNVPMRYRQVGCPLSNEPLGIDYGRACGVGGRAETLNGLFDEWMNTRKGLPICGNAAPRIGTIDWLFVEYKQSRAYLEKVKLRSRRNYEWNMREVCDTLTNRGDRVGSRPIKSVSPLGADKLYDRFVNGPKGKRLRTAEKLVVLCRKAWRVVHRLHPAEFPKDIPNPWLGVTLERRIKETKPSVTRDQVYAFAKGCVERGEIACGAAAVICFEWLQRPENVIAGHVKWTGYRTGPKPSIRIEHHKTGAVIDHPLEETMLDGSVVKFYEEAERILSNLTRRGVPMILRAVEEGVSKPYSFSGMQKIVQRMRKELGLPAFFTLDACRHGGMTELEEAELTDGQGRALSAHRTRESYAGYAKRTEARMLSATRKRHAHLLANQMATTVQNEAHEPVQNEKSRRGESS